MLLLSFLYTRTQHAGVLAVLFSSERLEEVHGAGKSDPTDCAQESDHPQNDWSLIGQPQLCGMRDSEQHECKAQAVEGCSGGSVHF